jgi:hypothetical protein
MQTSFVSRLLILSAFCVGGCQALTRQQGASAGSVCIASYNIDHTDIPNDSTIMFTMRDHTVYKNTLAYRCDGLRMDSRGFTYEPTDPGSDTICSNLVTIHLNTYRNVCQLGEFTKVSGPSHS